MNRTRIFTVAVLAVLACGSADAQNILGRLAERAKNAAENAVGNKIENAINGAIDKAPSKKDRNSNSKRQSGQDISDISGQEPPEMTRMTILQ